MKTGNIMIGSIGGVRSKTYRTMFNVGRAKYLIYADDGVKTYKDGSPFSGVDIFKNKKDFNAAIKRLESQGYKSK
jgi:hypothetical protein